jgi:hypothetical protein
LVIGNVAVTVFSFARYVNSRRSLFDVFVRSSLNAGGVAVVVYAIWWNAGIEEVFAGQQYGVVPSTLFLIFFSLASGSVVLQETWRRRHSIELSDPSEWVSAKERVSNAKKKRNHETTRNK